MTPKGKEYDRKVVPYHLHQFVMQAVTNLLCNVLVATISFGYTLRFSHLMYVNFHTSVAYSRIASSRDAVVSRRQKVKQMSAERKAQIQASVAWQQFCRDADEVRN